MPVDDPVAVCNLIVHITDMTSRGLRYAAAAILMAVAVLFVVAALELRRSRRK